MDMDFGNFSKILSGRGIEDEGRKCFSEKEMPLLSRERYWTGV
jgi:hypothetical protein